jgi:hypothetical protein
VDAVKFKLNLRGSREHPGTGASLADLREPGTTESIPSRSVGRDGRTPQPVVTICEDCERVVGFYFCEHCGSTRLDVVPDPRASTP